MYRVLGASDRLGFGDVISAPWLFDLYLRHDAVALAERDRGGSRTWFEQPGTRAEREAGKDGVLSHADHALGSGDRRQAIILTDDCEMESLLSKNSSGRILLAAVRVATSAELEAALARSTYRRFALPPDDASGFAGGIVELQRIYSVSLPSLAQNPPVHERVVSLDAEAQARLSQSLCAHATRHGPIVAARESAKLAMLMTANGDEDVIALFKARGSKKVPDSEHAAIAESITRCLSDAWQLEGRVLDEVSEAWERGDGPTGSVEAVKAELLRIHQAATEALARLNA